MITNPKTVTIASLRELGVGDDTLDLLSGRDGDSVPMTEDNALVCANDANWWWASQSMLSVEQREVYEAIRVPQHQAWVGACEPHLKAFEEACAPHWKALEDASDRGDFTTYLVAFNASEKTREAHQEALREACAPHCQAYNNACARAFATAYSG